MLDHNAQPIDALDDSIGAGAELTDKTLVTHRDDREIARQLALTESVASRQPADSGAP